MHLGRWLGVSPPSSRINETAQVSEYLQLELESELDDETFDLLWRRSRLDLQLWSALAERRLPGCDIETLRLKTIARGIARYARLLGPTLSRRDSLRKERDILAADRDGVCSEPDVLVAERDYKYA